MVALQVSRVPRVTRRHDVDDPADPQVDLDGDDDTPALRLLQDALEWLHVDAPAPGLSGHSVPPPCFVGLSSTGAVRAPGRGWVQE